MPAVRFGSVAIEAGVPTVVVSGENNTDATVNLTICNHANTGAQVQVFYTNQTCCVPSDADSLRPMSTIPGHGFMEIRGIALQENFYLVVRTASESVTAIAYGYEEGI